MLILFMISPLNWNIQIWKFILEPYLYLFEWIESKCVQTVHASIKWRPYTKWMHKRHDDWRHQRTYIDFRFRYLRWCERVSNFHATYPRQQNNNFQLINFANETSEFIVVCLYALYCVCTNICIYFTYVLLLYIKYSAVLINSYICSFDVHNIIT